MDGPQEGCSYAMLVGLAGEDEGLNGSAGNLENPERDATAITIVELDTGLMQDDLLNRVALQGGVAGQLGRQATGEPVWTHSGTGRTLAIRGVWWWMPAGLGPDWCPFLKEKLGSLVLPVQFSQQMKSKLGWGF